MKKTLLLVLALSLVACSKTDDDKAAPLLAKIDSLYAKGDYRTTLDSITRLRNNFPMAIEARRKALKVWQDASLKMAQADVAATDVQLQQTDAQIDSASNRLQHNMLCAKRDSLRARYEAMCGVVKMIKMRQKQGKEQ